jgi:2-C-methyl-D-erythritol 2,4-cyclodiphosphate synthase
MNLRIGFGVDAHRYGDGDAVVLGGVRIAHERGIVAHSDGDAALHALCDALLGCLAEGDIGHHFPDTDPRWKGVDSGVLLRKVAERVASRGYRVMNVDVTVIAQRPRLAPHIPAMRERIASLLGVAVDQVSVKATTTETMGFTGREEGLAAQAVALIASAASGQSA